MVGRGNIARRVAVWRGMVGRGPSVVRRGSPMMRRRRVVGRGSAAMIAGIGLGAQLVGIAYPVPALLNQPRRLLLLFGRYHCARVLVCRRAFPVVGRTAAVGGGRRAVVSPPTVYVGRATVRFFAPAGGQAGDTRPGAMPAALK